MEQRENNEMEELTAPTCPEEEQVTSHHEHHEHHHHHHHKHSKHHHRSSKKGIWKNFKRFCKKNKTVVRAVILVLAVLLALLTLGVVAHLLSADRQPSSAQTNSTEGTLILAVPVFDEPVSIVNSAARTIFENAQKNAVADKLIEPYWSNNTRLDVCAPVILSFRLINKPADYTLTGFTVDIGENMQLDPCSSYALEASAQSFDLINLKTQTQYYYRICAHFSNDVTTAVSGSFRTGSGPRVMTVGGIRNVRDIGGWKTLDGKTIQQGLLYRGTEMDGAVESQYLLTEEGRDTLLSELGIRTDLDLRWETEIPHKVDPLGADAAHIYHGAPLYTDCLLEENRQYMKNIFSDLADPALYPMYMHCTYGLDRTGTVCALLEALLGVSEMDILKDYQLSALYRGQVNEIAFGNFLTALNGFPGDSLQEKTEAFLLSVGVTEGEIASIKNIFLKN